MKPTLLLLACLIGLAVPLPGVAQPTITLGPDSQSVAQGADVTFLVEATGTGPLTYHWQKDSVDLPESTESHLILTNVQPAHAGDYRVVVTNIEGAVTSAAAHTLTVLIPPRIVPTVSLQHASVFMGEANTFIAAASGTTPLSYQWRLDGRDLPGETNKTLKLASAQPSEEGDYTVVVANEAGWAMSEPARLWVIPPISTVIRGNFTNQLGQRLPYYYLLPTDYDPTRRYPLFCRFHGSGGSVLYPPGSSGLRLGSFKQQATDPAILVFPTRWNEGEDWTDQYLKLTSGLLDQLISQFNIDTNRVYVAGASQGVHAAWDLLGMRPGFFAAAFFQAGWPGNALPKAIKNVPLWVGCAADDEIVGVGDSRNMVSALRRVGGTPIYTEYTSGGHVGGIVMHILTPVANDWLLAQRRGLPPTYEPHLSITSPTREALHTTGGTNINLGGSATALGGAVTKVAWENATTGAKGAALGTNAWSVTDIPLKSSRTNLIFITATTTSWAPAFRGNTTFNGVLTVFQSPLIATLVLQGENALLNWTGGGPPYLVQQATDLAADDWTDLLTDATSPVTLPLTGQPGFHRVVGQ